MKAVYVKNMVCQRCVTAVESALERLNIPYVSVDFGKVNLTDTMSEKQYSEFKNALPALGFELLESNTAILISKIKKVVIQSIHHSDEDRKMNFSTLISEELGHDYTYLSRLFSSVEGLTIEKYIMRQRVEKVKELILYDELSLSEIAFRLQYNSVAYLSAQFKKETGMTITEFRKVQSPWRKSIDAI